MHKLIGLILAFLFIGSIFVFPFEYAKGFFHLIQLGSTIHDALRQ